MLKKEVIDLKLNNLGKKLLLEGSETICVKIDLVSLMIGFFMLLSGAACIMIKVLLESRMGEEIFSLIPIGFFVMFTGIIIFIVTGIRNVCKIMRNPKQEIRNKCNAIISGCACVVFSYLSFVLFLAEANSERNPLLALLACWSVSIVSGILFLRARARTYKIH